MSHKQRSEIIAKLNKLESNSYDNIYDKDIERLNFFSDHGLWFDLVNQLENMLFKYPDEITLNEYKQTLYADFNTQQNNL